MNRDLWAATVEIYFVSKTVSTSQNWTDISATTFCLRQRFMIDCGMSKSFSTMALKLTRMFTYANFSDTG